MITIVHIEPMSMAYIKGNDNIFTLDQPAVQAYIARPLYKVLNGDKRIGTFLYGYAKTKHAYLQDYSLWSNEPGERNGLNRSAWSGICLSSHEDDVTRNIKRHNYSDAAFGLTQWGTSYNMDTTNPYNSPNVIVYLQGIPAFLKPEPGRTEKDHHEALRAFKALINFNEMDCFTTRLGRHKTVEFAEHPELRNLTSRIDNSQRSNRMMFGHHLIEQCKECPVIHDCRKMQEQIQVELAFEDDRYGIAEAITAETMQIEDHIKDRNAELVYARFVYIMDAISIDNQKDIYAWMVYYLEEHGFFNEPLTPAEEAQQVLEREMIMWSQTGGTNG
jgi:hypothetical protein